VGLDEQPAAPGLGKHLGEARDALHGLVAVQVHAVEAGGV
jgi:hypothetical protein